MFSLIQARMSLLNSRMKKIEGQVFPTNQKEFSSEIFPLHLLTIYAELLSFLTPSNWLLRMTVYGRVSFHLITKKLSRAPGNKSFSSKRELYFQLCNYILIDNDRKRFSLEKPTGKKCYTFFARELGIVDSHKKECWSWISLPGSRFKQHAKANGVWDLKVKHKINTNMLSPKTTYTAYLILSYQKKLPRAQCTPCRYKSQTWR